MPRPKTLYMGAINITLHPHKPETYIELFEAVLDGTQMADAGMNHKMFLGRLGTIVDDKPLDGLAGDFYRFFNLDKKSAWIDVVERRALKRGEASRMKEIPENLKPDASRFQFVFFPDTHKLIFTLKGEYFENSLTKPRAAPSISPNRMVFVLEELFSTPKIVKKFGKVSVTAIPIKEKVEELLNLKRLQILTIDLTRPNPDDFATIERRHFKKLDDQNIDKQTVIVHAASADGIKPDEDTKQLARVAASNGKVRAEGYDAAGKKRIESTVSHPHIETAQYYPKTQQVIEVLIEKAGAFIRKIKI